MTSVNIAWPIDTVSLLLSLLTGHHIHVIPTSFSWPSVLIALQTAVNFTRTVWRIYGQMNGLAVLYVAGYVKIPLDNIFIELRQL